MRSFADPGGEFHAEGAAVLDSQGNQGARSEEGIGERGVQAREAEARPPWALLKNSHKHAPLFVFTPPPYSSKDLKWLLL